MMGRQESICGSNNPTVVPNNGFSARMDGDLKILMLLGANTGTTVAYCHPEPQCLGHTAGQ